MKPIADFEFPREQQRILTKARRLEWLTIVYIATSSIFLFLTMGESQAMRTSFFEGAISAVPAMAFLFCTRIALRPPSRDFPYGFHGIVSIGYLTASLALTAMGIYLLTDSSIKAFSGEMVEIGELELFGHRIWAGWAMYAALLYAAVPTFFLGYAKSKLAPRIHDKILFADAQMMRADWMFDVGTAAGVTGLAFGLWWADPLAAAVVSLSVLKDGIINVVAAVDDLMERWPMQTDRSGREPAPMLLKHKIDALDWVAESQVRLREVGHVFFGEVFVRPKPDVKDLPRRVREARESTKRLNWRLHDVTVTVMDKLEPIGEEAAQDDAS